MPNVDHFEFQFKESGCIKITVNPDTHQTAVLTEIATRPHR